MAVSATRSITITYTGDIRAANTFAAASNAASPGDMDVVTLAAGANTITPPTGGTTPKACTIIFPSGNIVLVTLKGVAGDTGIVLHLTDPVTITLNNPVSTFVLDAGVGGVTGVRLIWS